MTHSPAWLVLFDIDGTLLLSGRAGLRGLNLAFERRYGRPRVLDRIAFAGRTDRAIVGEALASIGVAATSDEIAALRDTYCACLAEEIGRPVSAPCGVLPGVPALLDWLAARDEVAVGVLTGNFQKSAAIKLRHFDLDGRFRFGAFGDDHEDRRDLVPVALASAAGRGIAPPPSARIIVIGDTPEDIACAHAHGARAVGVATGPFDAAALTAAGADLVLETLSNHIELTRWWAAL